MKDGNRLLRVIHGHRLAGTLDALEPDESTTADIGQSDHLPPALLSRGLAWLRANVSIDEDAAILTRIEREEAIAAEEEEEAIRGASQYHPQSGYESQVRQRRQREELRKRQKAEQNQQDQQGEPSGQEPKQEEEEGRAPDMHGSSVLQQVRAANEAANARRAEEERREWLEGAERDRVLLERRRREAGNAGLAVQLADEQGITQGNVVEQLPIYCPILFDDEHKLTPHSARGSRAAPCSRVDSAASPSRNQHGRCVWSDE